MRILNFWRGCLNYVSFSLYVSLYIYVLYVFVFVFHNLYCVCVCVFSSSILYLSTLLWKASSLKGFSLSRCQILNLCLCFKLYWFLTCFGTSPLCSTSPLDPEPVTGNMESAMAVELNPWVEYEFRVVATNGIGTGDPSTPSRAVRTKEAGICHWFIHPWMSLS